ncbi:MAG: squalene--hopene cyclase [Verrucomicrobia bacterium]|nr:squalene--hopene cyclase [Verrucomicrobiota bacterium]
METKSQLDATIDRTIAWLRGQQRPDGHWCAELEGDTILESEYLMYLHWLGKLSPESLRKCVNYIITKQSPDGGWCIYPGGPPDLSASVKAYMVCKWAGHSADETFMRRAREAILAKGGASRVNSYTRIFLWLIGLYDFEHVAAIPAELNAMPKWFYFNIYDMSAWSRTMIVPLTVLYHYKPVRPWRDPHCIDELFIGGPEKADYSFPRDPSLISWRNFFLVLNWWLRFWEGIPFKPLRNYSLKLAEQWMKPRIADGGSLGAIYPAMMNAVLALRALGYKDDDPLMKHAEEKLEELRIEEGSTLRLQPCFSPIWDTAWVIGNLRAAGVSANDPALVKATQWLLDRELKCEGDWKVKWPNARPAGWPFEYANKFYPDFDDTAIVIRVIRDIEVKDIRERDAAIERAIQFQLAMQNRDGGWASFDKDNTHEVFTKIPFADHNAMLDPTSLDVTGRMLETFGALGWDISREPVQRALHLVKSHQEHDGCWFGRWGVNYIYGTWQVLIGLAAIGEDMQAPYVRRAVKWLIDHQQADGGWGESCATYDDPSLRGTGKTTASQTAWAVHALVTVGEGNHPAVQRGVEWLLARQNPDGTWTENEFTGTGFPKVFYLKYHWYRIYFPLLALAAYRSQHRQADGK